MTPPEPIYRLPGGRIAVASRTEWVRAALAAAELLGPAAWWTHRQIRTRPERLNVATVQWAARCRRRLAIDLEVRGLEHIDPHQGYVVAALHESFADAVAILDLPLRLAVAARSELLEWNALGKWLSASHAPLVDPERPVTGYRTLLRFAENTLQRDESVLVFPQGTILGIETSFHRGAFHLAGRLDRPLLPVVVAGGHRVWEYPFSPRLRFGQPMLVAVLPPVPGREALSAMPEIERRMKSLAVTQWRAPVRHFVPERDGWWDGYAYGIDAEHRELAGRVAAHRRRHIIDT